MPVPERDLAGDAEERDVRSFASAPALLDVLARTLHGVDPVSVACRRSRAFAARSCGVTERSEGNPRSGLTPQGRAAALAAETAGDA